MSRFSWAASRARRFFRSPGTRSHRCEMVLRPGLALALSAAGLWLSCTPARVDDDFREIETKYIFGFTIGSGIGLGGEKEVTTETIAALGKRDGRYAATETKAEFEFTPNQYVQIELGTLVASHNIGRVTDLDDRNQVALSGAFGELRYLAVEL